MTWYWWIFSRIFRREYDLLFDVMHEYADNVLDDETDTWAPAVEALGIRMGCWSEGETRY